MMLYLLVKHQLSASLLYISHQRAYTIITKYIPAELTKVPVTPAPSEYVTTHMFTYLLPLLLIYIYGHNRSIFGRSSKSHRPICGTRVNHECLPFTAFIHVLPCIREIILHSMLLLYLIYNSNPVE